MRSFCFSVAAMRSHNTQCFCQEATRHSTSWAPILVGQDTTTAQYRLTTIDSQHSKDMLEEDGRKNMTRDAENTMIRDINY